MIRSISYPRAALFGNPSDGFFGKTIAFPFRDFQAEVTLVPRKAGIILQEADETYPNFNALQKAISQKQRLKHLLPATLRRFLAYCEDNSITLPEKGFEIKFQSNIPRQVGMAGSSAIITATWRVLMKYFELEIPAHLLANEVLAVETMEMGIGAGLQDRVVQAYECPVYMDFQKDLMHRQGFGHYEPLPKNVFHNLYIAYMDGAPEGSEVVHNDLRSRYDQGETQVHDVMRALAELTTTAKGELESDDGWKNLGKLINQNFDLRESICQIAPAHLKMIQTARATGASAKFTGSGGTIIGQYTSDEVFEHLKHQFTEQDIHIFKPTIVSHS